MKLWRSNVGAVVAEDIFFIFFSLFHLGDIAAVGLGEGVAVGDIGLDVEDGGLVEEVDAFNLEKVAVDAQEAKGAEADGVGAVWGAGCEGSAFYFRTAWWGDGGVPVFVEVEPGDDPDVVEAFEVFEGDRRNHILKQFNRRRGGLVILGGGLQLGLARGAVALGVGRSHLSNGLHGDFSGKFNRLDVSLLGQLGHGMGRGKDAAFSIGESPLAERRQSQWCLGRCR